MYLVMVWAGLTLIFFCLFFLKSSLETIGIGFISQENSNTQVVAQGTPVVLNTVPTRTGDYGKLTQ